MFAVYDYWDQPLDGVANYSGRPHYYKRLFDKEKDTWSDLFLLEPLDDETAQLVAEEQSILRRWDVEYQQNQASLSEVLPTDQVRYDQIRDILSKRLVVDSSKDTRAIGEFQLLESTRQGKRVTVLHTRWTVTWRAPSEGASL